MDPKPPVIKQRRIILPIIRRTLPSLFHPDLEKEMEEAIKKDMKRQMEENKGKKKLKEDLEEFSTKFGEDE